MITRISSVDSEELLSILERDELILTRNLKTGEERNTIEAFLYRQFAGRYREVIRSHGNITVKQEMKELCTKLDEADNALANVSLDSIPEEVIDAELQNTGEATIDQRAALEERYNAIKEHVQKCILRKRKELRRYLEERSGWRKEPLTRKNKPTSRGLQILNRVREASKLEPHCVDGDQYMSKEEVTMSAAIAAGIGEAALADFWAHIAPDRFDYNNRTWRNLREWIGDAEAYSGTIVEDIPESILIRPPLGAIRELLFNQMRDKLYREQYRGATSVDDVLLELEVMTDNVHTKMEEEKEKLRNGGNGRTEEDVEKERDARLRFIQELTDYFLEVESLLDSRPERLKKSLNGNGDTFPAPHQLIAIKEIIRLRQILIADEVGAGKTAETLGGFEYLREMNEEQKEHHEKKVDVTISGFDILKNTLGASKALIICPNAVVVDVWKERLSKYFQKPPSYVVIESEDSPKRRGEKWLQAKEDADYILMNIDMTRAESVINDQEFAQSLGVPVGNRVNHELLCQNIGADFLVVDEGQSIRNIRGSQQETVFQISQCESIRNGHTVVLTATPMYNNIDDLAAFIRLLNAGHDRANIPGLPEEIDYTDVGAIKRAITSNHTRLVRNLLFLRMLRRETKDCLPVGVEFTEEPPNRTPFSPLEQEDYNVLIEQPWDIILSKIRSLQWNCIHGGKEKAQEFGVASCTKYKQIKEQVLQDIATLQAEGRPGPYKIFLCVYHHAMDAQGVTREFSTNGITGSHDPNKSRTNEYIAGALRAELKEKNIQVFVIDGTNSKQAARILDQSRECKDNCVLIARSNIIGEGDDLSFMDSMRSITPTTVPGERVQGIGRVNRLGRKHPVTYRDNIIANTIEEGMHRVERCKRGAAEDLLRGAPLSPDEIEMLEESNKKIRRGGFLAYETKTPLQKIMHIFNRMFRQGKERAREILSVDNGRYAQELAQYYADYEEVTLPGNNRRAILTLLQKHMPELREIFSGDRIQIADIGSGPMALARSLAHEKDIDVFSTDISKPMIEMGKMLWKKHVGEDISNIQAIPCAMDEIMDATEYEPSSMHIAVNSLSLQYTKHNYKKRNEGGNERIHSLCRMNEVLVDGGIGFIALPVGIFHESSKYLEICTVLRSHFGLEVIEEDSGHMQTIPGPGEPMYESTIFTVRKIGPPNVIGMSQEAWNMLHFSHTVPTHVQDSPKLVQRSVEEIHPTEGSYSEDFVIGTQRLHYNTPENLSKAKREFHEEMTECEKAQRRIEALLKKHNTKLFEKIPAEELLSFTLDELDEVGQEALDAYMRALLREYKGNLYEIPTEKLTKHSAIVLKHGSTKKKTGKGSKKIEVPYIYIARLDGKKRKGGRKRYFAENEFDDEEEINQFS